MIENDKQLGRALRRMAKLYAQAHTIEAEVNAYSESIYGVAPSDIDNDEFIDSCIGGMGLAEGMSAAEFHVSMRRRLERLERGW